MGALRHIKGGGYLRFRSLGKKPGQKTLRWRVTNHNGVGLGTVVFYGAWRKYTFEPDAGTRWSDDCAEALAVFLKDQTKKWRQGLKK